MDWTICVMNWTAYMLGVSLGMAISALIIALGPYIKRWKR